MAEQPAPTQPDIAPLLQPYPVVVYFPVAWGEMDALGHVNNIVYFRYFESARVAYFAQIDFFGVLERTGVGPILAETRCRFRLPLHYPDTVALGTSVADMGEDAFLMRYAVVSTRHGRLAAEGEGRIVSYDYRAGHKTPLPDDLRQRIIALEARTT